MKFNVLVTGGVYSSQSAYSALQFCKASVAAGHTISHVFFYRDAVTQASSLSVPLDDEFNAVDQWQSFQQQHQIPLVVCVSAAERRGVLSAEQAQEFAKPSSNLATGFTIEGLGALHDASLAADRTVTFK